MKSRTAINLLLFALVIALAAVAWFQPGVKPETAAAPSALTRLKLSDVKRIRIEPASAQSSAFELRNGKWWMTEPIEAPVNDFRVESVLRIAEAKSSRQYAVGDVDLVATGLAQPKVKLVFNDEPPLAFGGTEPISQKRYVRNGNRVFLMDDLGYYSIVGGYTTFVDPSLLPANADVEALELPGLALKHDKDGWKGEPMPKDFSADRVNALIDAWRHAQALEVRPAAAAGKAQGTITIRMANQPKPLQFEIRSQTPEFVLVRNDLHLEYHLAADMAHNLLRLPETVAADPPH